jgi:two-component system, NtrC family, sensor kinase
MRLWMKLAVVMAGVSIGPLMVTGLGAVDISTENAEYNASLMLEREAVAQAEFVGRWTNDQVQALVGWMQPFGLETMPQKNQTSLLRAVWSAVPSSVVTTFVDRDGSLVLPAVYLKDAKSRVAGPGRTVGSDRRAEQLLQRLPVSDIGRRTQAVAVGAPYVADGAKYPSLPIVVAGPFVQNVLLGVEFSLATQVEHFRRSSAPERAMALLDGDGKPLVGGEHLLIDAAGLAPLLRNRAFFTQTNGDAQVKGAVAPVPYTDWTVVVAEPADLALASANEIRGRTLRVLLFSILLATTVGVVVARSLSTPVGHLRDSALAVASGKYGQQASVERADELGELAKAFNHMSSRLQTNQDEISEQQQAIKELNADLQRRVELRTKELTDAQAQLVRAGQLAAVAEVGAGLAHELNNPVAAILGWVQVLRAKEVAVGEQEALERIEAEASRCRDVVAAMLRVSSGELDPKLQPVVDLREVLTEVFGLVRGPFRQRGLTLSMSQQDTSLMVRMDPVHGSRLFAQIFNALRAAMPEGAELSVRARAGEKSVKVFLSADHPVEMTDDWMVSGMGLWVARQLLRQLGGRLEEPEAGVATPVWTVALPGVG